MSPPVRILIVDDNASMRQHMRAFLEIHADLDVCGEACDGLEGIEKSSALRPDLIILDLSMPRMDGLEAAAALQQTMPRVPIILFTLHVNETLDRRARAAGIASVLSKMDSMEALRGEVRRLAACVAAP